jgi:hypothetical protein
LSAITGSSRFRRKFLSRDRTDHRRVHRLDRLIRLSVELGQRIGRILFAGGHDDRVVTGQVAGLDPDRLDRCRLGGC